MLLVCDIGNTAISCGLYKGDRLAFFTSHPTLDDDYDGLASRIASQGKVKGGLVSVVCSVNPTAERKLSISLKKIFKIKPLIIGRDIDINVPVSYRNPDELGSDRLINALAAKRMFNTACIVVDFGTAVTFDVIGRTGKYLGGIIAPGINLTRRALSEWTALLPLVDVTPGGPLIGKSTEEAINSGLFHGIVAMVDGLLFSLIRNMRTEPRIIATGGDGKAVTEKSKYIENWIPDLTLRGILQAYREHAEKKK